MENSTVAYWIVIITLLVILGMGIWLLVSVKLTTASTQAEVDAFNLNYDVQGWFIVIGAVIAAIAIFFYKK